MNAGGKVYTPKTTHEAQQAFAWEIKAVYMGLLPDADSAFGVRMAFYTKSRQRRDLDNMCKLVCDACTGIIWGDDSQVEEIIARVTRADKTPRTEIAVYTIRTTTPYIQCEVCKKTVRIYPSWGERKYCGRKCSSLAQQSRKEWICSHCSAEFDVHTYRPESVRGLRFCSEKCRVEHTTVAIVCCQCGSDYRKPRSQVKSGRAFCSMSCQSKFWVGHRKKAAMGVCGDCGGPTTKKSYLRCMSCQLAHRVKNRQDALVDAGILVDDTRKYLRQGPVEILGTKKEHGGRAGVLVKLRGEKEDGAD